MVDDTRIIPINPDAGIDPDMFDPRFGPPAGSTTAGASAPMGFSGTDPDATPADGDSEGKITFDPEPNVLSSLAQPSYAFSLYLLNDQNPNEENKVVLAETGVTGLNIQEVTINSIAGPNMQTRSALATNITIKIHEPYGVNFPDRMIAAARKMQIKNYHKAPWHLSLKFLGYNEDGTPADVDAGPWKWSLNILDVQSKIDETGSVHVITAIPFNEVALQNEFSILATNVSLTGETVGDAVKQLVETLNQDILKRYDAYPFVKYDIVDEPYETGSGGSSSVSRPFEHKMKSDAPQFDNERNAEGGQFSSGTSIENVIESLFSRSPTAIKQAMHSRSLNFADSEAEATEVVSLMHRIDTDIKLGKYDVKTRDYAKEITFTVKPYQSLRLITNASPPSSIEEEDKISSKKIKHAIDNLLLVKKYDYLFTGKNTEVEKFDIDINFRWAVQAPKLYASSGGIATVHYDAETRPREIRDEPEQAQDIGEMFTTISGELDALKAKNDPSLSAQIAKKEEELKLLQGIATANRSGDAVLAQETGAPADATGAEGSSYAEDLPRELSEVSPAMPVSYVNASEDQRQQVQWGTSGQSDAGKSVYGTLLNQLYGSFDGNLQNIQMNIKGDPYWLGTPKKEGEESVAEPSSSAASSASMANFMNGDHMFMFTFRLPSGFDEESGTASVATDSTTSGEELFEAGEAFSGFYAAIQIEHSFSAGAFRQSVQGVRVPYMNIKQIIEGSAEGAAPSGS